MEIKKQVKKLIEKDEYGLYKKAPNYNTCRNNIEAVIKVRKEALENVNIFSV